MHKVICNVQCKHALPNVEFLCYDYTLASVRKCYELYQLYVMNYSSVKSKTVLMKHEHSSHRKNTWNINMFYELLFLIATSEMFNKLAHVYNRF